MSPVAHIVFWTDRQKWQGVTHANFDLQQSDQGIALYDAISRGNQLIDSVSFDEQYSDVSFGRIPDGDVSWSLLATPSPQTTNGTFICGNIDDIVGPGGPVDVSDLSYLVAYLFQGGPMPSVLLSANVNGQNGPAGPVDISDLTYLIDYLSKGGPEPVCE